MNNNMLVMKNAFDCGPVALAYYIDSQKSYNVWLLYDQISKFMDWPNKCNWQDNACDNPYHHLLVVEKFLGVKPGIKHGAIESNHGVALLFTNQGYAHWVYYEPERYFNGFEFVDGRPGQSGDVVIMSYSMEYKDSIANALYYIYHVLVKCILGVTR